MYYVINLVNNNNKSFCITDILLIANKYSYNYNLTNINVLINIMRIFFKKI